MKICFIWVEKYRNFENLGLNLSSSTKFKFNQEDNFLSKVDCTTLPQDFFGEKIEDVIGLIGKNGSGKSNALALICNTLKGSKSGINTQFLIVTEENGFFKCHYSFDKNTNSPRAAFQIDILSYVGEIKDLKLIYFSNVFSDRPNNFGKGVSDISVTNTARKIWFRSKKSDFEKQINLINSRIFRKINIDFPSRIRFATKLFNRTNSSMQMREEQVHPGLNNLKSLFRSRLRDIVGKNKFFHLIRFSFFEHVLRFKSDTPEYNNFLEKINHFTESLLNAQRTEDISEGLIEFISENIPSVALTFSENSFSGNTEIDLVRLREQIEFLLHIKENFLEIEIENSSEGLRNRAIDYFDIVFDSASKNLITHFVSLFRETISMDIDWNGISSGHRAYLNLFSSIYEELKNTRQDFLLLCIDEGDLYLHPHWQVEFFNKLLSVLSEIFRGRIQLVLTSHSPFLLSDLPNQCITILVKDSIGGTMNGIELRGQTFGANLYDLYAEPFFLGNRKMSDFAYNKIANYLEEIEDKSNVLQKRKTDISELIGDEVIRFKVKKLLSHD